MDLDAEADRLRLDLLAYRVSTTLAAAGIGHALLKGPTTATWLYEPPRRYRDVDVLVGPDRVPAAVAALAAAGVASADAGRFGEQAPHSRLLHAPGGHEVDLHASLPAAPLRGPATWEVLRRHLVEFELAGVGRVPALDLPARVVVLALHAVGSGPAETVPTEDLRRAWAAVGPAGHRTAAGLAAELDLSPLVRAGLTRAGVDPSELPVDRPADRLADRPGEGPTTTRAALLLTSSTPSARALQGLVELPPRARVRALASELLPSRSFMAAAHPGSDAGSAPLARAHLRRWRGIAATLPRAARELRRARRAARGPRREA